MKIIAIAGKDHVMIERPGGRYLAVLIYLGGYKEIIELEDKIKAAAYQKFDVWEPPPDDMKVEDILTPQEIKKYTE